MTTQTSTHQKVNPSKLTTYHANGPQTGDNISRQTLFWLLLTNIAVLSPLFDKTTPWTLGICAICLVWRVGIYVGKVAKPPRYLVTSLAIGAAITLALVSGEIGLLNALVNLLILGYALKYIEMRSVRDVRAVVIVGYFLIALTFIDHQSMLNTVHLIGVTIINTCVLVTLYQSKHNWQHTAWIGAKLLLQSVPLALLLFLVLPRFAPLWLVPNMKEAQTGLSDTLSVSDISKLTRSSALAFRVSFTQASPIQAELYWRALVLEDYDGQTWRQDVGIKQIQKDALFFPPSRPDPARQLPTAMMDDTGSNAPQRYDYQVIVEPSHQPWLFGLDVAYSQDEKVINLPDYRLYSLRNVDQRMGYSARSFPKAQMDLKLSAKQRQINLKLPEDTNPKTLALATEFKANYPEPKQRLLAMMGYFNREPFFYTLTPPPIGPQQVDDFLFENKAGFCAHYASAFIFLARATGLPARMVTGYQGGEYNPQADYLSVYQYMAHAWAEVWLENEGWVRFDPTAMVAPNRIEQGFDAEFSPEQSYLQESPFSSLRFKTMPWLNELRQRFASLDYYWSLWVLGFNQERQNKVLSGILGDVTKTKVAVFMSVCISLIGLYIAYSVGLFRFKREQDPISAKYQRICQRLSKFGITRPAHLGPNAFAAQLIDTHQQQSPQFCREFDTLTQSYVALKYQQLADGDYQTALKRFNAAAKALNWRLFGPSKQLK
ncbi:transglutaminase TgpA family protein [Shewanella mangrovisoli]|uniref:transglutaminase TgpA family protein n=1 Tax=Shewanella mangrovisoli TaxID=2864211 RepID=UPI0035B875B8